jgi:hypothetical protein
LADAFGDGGGGLVGGETALELLGGDEDAHGGRVQVTGDNGQMRQKLR